MTTHALPGHSRWRLPAGLALALLVQAALLLLLQLDRSRTRHAPPEAAKLLTLRLFAPRPPEAPPKTRPLDARKAQQPGSAQPAFAVAPAAESAAPAPSMTAPSAIAVTAIAAPLVPLNLSLPPQRAASGPRGESVVSRALNDPRSNSAKRTVEFAVADAAGTLPVEVQDSTDGTGARLIRQGSKCTRVRESRARMLNPMDEGLKGTPSTAGAC